MSVGTDYIKKLAIEGAAARLKRAANLTELHAPNPLFSWEIEPRCSLPTKLKLDTHGVLRVFDNTTGEILAESLPGKWDQLSPDFCPPLAT